MSVYAADIHHAVYVHNINELMISFRLDARMAREEREAGAVGRGDNDDVCKYGLQHDG